MRNGLADVHHAAALQTADNRLQAAAFHNHLIGNGNDPFVPANIPVPYGQPLIRPGPPPVPYERPPISQGHSSTMGEVQPSASRSRHNRAQLRMPSLAQGRNSRVSSRRPSPQSHVRQSSHSSSRPYRSRSPNDSSCSCSSRSPQSRYSRNYSARSRRESNRSPYVSRSRLPSNHAHIDSSLRGIFPRGSFCDDDSNDTSSNPGQHFLPAAAVNDTSSNPGQPSLPATAVNDTSFNAGHSFQHIVDDADNSASAIQPPPIVDNATASASLAAAVHYQGNKSKRGNKVHKHHRMFDEATRRSIQTYEDWLANLQRADHSTV